MIDEIISSKGAVIMSEDVGTKKELTTEGRIYYLFDRSRKYKCKNSKC